MTPAKDVIERVRNDVDIRAPDILDYLVGEVLDNLSPGDELPNGLLVIDPNEKNIIWKCNERFILRGWKYVATN